MRLETIIPFVCPARGATQFWYLSDGQRVCEVCFPKKCTPLRDVLPVNEDHLYRKDTHR
jgi:hypothetical protein